jgi:histidine triad (HIT) family protein
MSECIFCKIVAGKIPTKLIHEDDELIAFHDINPSAPMHLLIVPKVHVETLADCGEQHTAMLGKMLLLAPKLALAQGSGYANSKGGFKTLVNTGPDGGQEVYHLHMHVLGGPRPWAKQNPA